MNNDKIQAEIADLQDVINLSRRPTDDPKQRAHRAELVAWATQRQKRYIDTLAVLTDYDRLRHRIDRGHPHDRKHPHDKIGTIEMIEMMERMAAVLRQP